MPPVLRWRWMLMDVACLWMAAAGGDVIRFGWSADEHVLSYIAVAVCMSIELALLGNLLGIYRGRFRSCSFDEVRLLGCTVALCVAALTLVMLLISMSLAPGSAPAVTGLLGLALMVTVRTNVRWQRERRGRPVDAEPVIMFGAGEAGGQLARAMHRDRRSPYRAIAFLDDDPKKRNLRLEAVPVVGTREAVAAVAARTGARILTVSVARADSALLEDLAKRCDAAGIRMLVLPPVAQLVHERAQLRDIRDLNVADLMGRAPIDIDSSAIAELLRGQRVLITGAGGSIGSELARQIHRFEPASLMLLDRDESALHAVQLSIEGHALLDTDDLILADIRDRDAIMRIFTRRRPSVVFHAAALKHLPLLERAPSEAVKTNILGTLNIMEAAKAAGARLFVNVSTDKAANPISVLGYSKRITERLTAHAAECNHGNYLSVRFGNVVGSRGSVLTTFDDQIRNGGPVTVTDPDVRRYFMTIPEAAQLVLQAASCGRSGEILILDMGEPIRIADIAQRLINFAGADVDIEYTGLRQGEKRDEDLLGDGEVGSRPSHPKIIQVAGAPLSPETLAFALDGERVDVRNQLRSIAMRPVDVEPAAGPGDAVISLPEFGHVLEFD